MEDPPASEMNRIGEAGKRAGRSEENAEMKEEKEEGRWGLSIRPDA